MGARYMFHGFAQAKRMLAFTILLTACSSEPAIERSEDVLAALNSTSDIEVDWAIQGIPVIDDTGEYIQIDDMLFPKATDSTSRIVTAGAYGLMWPNGSFSYNLSDDVRSDPFKKSQFEAACKSLTMGSGVACSELKGSTSGKSFVQVVSGTQNRSVVGFKGGKQYLEIASWNNKVVIAHEIKHALGWVHEHQRPDRDTFVNIEWQNINRAAGINFQKFVSASSQSPYDFGSMMHYGSRDFSTNGRASITPKPGYEIPAREMGQRSRIAASDLKDVIGVYGDQTTEWCGRSRRSSSRIPEGCFLDCNWNSESGYGRWRLCGRCESRRDPCP